MLFCIITFIKKYDKEHFMITAEQGRAARALLDWSRERLAEASRVSLRTIIDFERRARVPRFLTLDALRRALEAGGVEFIPENGGGAGVRLRKGGPRGDPDASIKVENLTAENDD
jgi:transcriptional regulator with XRE-family HTH domain